MTKRSSFKKIYLIFLGVLALIMVFCLIHVGSVLKEYESSQPENIAVEQFRAMQKAAKKDKLGSFLEGYIDLSANEITKATEKIASAKGKATSKLIKNEDGGETLTYAIISDGERVADVTLKSKGTGKTRLAILTMAEWEAIFIGPARYEYKLTLPASMTVLLNGETVAGTASGNNKTYDFAGFIDQPDVVIRDSLGKEMKYDGVSKLDITKYSVQIPSNYKITSADGIFTVPVNSATLADIDDYKYVAQYTEMPKTATYSIGIFGDSADFVITDNLGNKVDYTLDGHTVKIDGQASLAEIPEDIYSAKDILAQAKKWSLFMTADLGGAKHGYGQVEEFLLPDSYLMDVAYKWATGVDITFTSVHTLDNPPFSVANVSGFVKYSDICFSADVTLTKIMHLNSGANVADTMNSRFYYIQKDGTWYVADIQEILEQ